VEMRLRSIEESSVWKNREKGEAQIPSSLSLTFPQTRRARLDVAPLITAYRFPGFQQSQWTDTMKPVLVASDEVTPHHRYFPEVDIQEEDRFVFHEDASKLIRWRDGNLDVFYFGLTAQREPSGQIRLPDHFPEAALDEFRKELSQGEICAFVCAPRLNPLTGQVIGPDRERVKAIAILGDPSDGLDVPVWFTEVYQPIGAGDVLGDLHRWRDSEAELIEVPFREGWWTKLLLSDQAPQGSTEFEDQAPPARAWSNQFKNRDGNAVWQGLRYPVAVPGRDKKREASTTPSENGRPLSLGDIPVFDKAEQDTPALHDDIRTFLKEHYAKLSRMDFEPYLDDYTEYIVYHGKPGRKSEDLLPSAHSLKNVTSLSTHLFDRIRVKSDNADNKERYLADFSMQLSIESSPETFRIVSTPVRMGIFKQGNTFRIVSVDRTDATRPDANLPSIDQARDPVLPEVRELVGKFLDDHLSGLISPDEEWVDQHVTEPVKLVPELYRLSRSAVVKFANPESDSPLSLERIGSYHIFAIDSGREHYVVKCQSEISATSNPDLPRKFFLVHWIHLRNGTPFITGRARTLFHP